MQRVINKFGSRDFQNRIQAAANGTIQEVAEIAKQTMQKFYASGHPAHKPLYYQTVAHKSYQGSTTPDQPLHRFGSLAKSIKVKIKGSGDSIEALIGPPPGRESLKAAVHEKGVRIRVTDAMRNYLAYQGIIISPNTAFIVIPARPVMKYVATATQAEIIRRGIKNIKVEVANL